MDTTVAERMRRYRARLRGEDVPRRKPGRPSQCVAPQGVAGVLRGIDAPSPVVPQRKPASMHGIDAQIPEPVALSPWASYTALARDHDIKRGHLDAWVMAHKIKTRDAVDGSCEYLLADVLRERDAVTAR